MVISEGDTSYKFNPKNVIISETLLQNGWTDLGEIFCVCSSWFENGFEFRIAIRPTGNLLKSLKFWISDAYTRQCLLGLVV